MNILTIMSKLITPVYRWFLAVLLLFMMCLPPANIQAQEDSPVPEPENVVQEEMPQDSPMPEEIVPDNPPEGYIPMPPKPQTSGDSQPQTEKSPGLISLNFDNAELADILKALSDKSGWNIIISPNVRGTITVKLNDVTLEQALEAILVINGFTYRKQGNIIQVIGQADLNRIEESASKDTKIVILKYAKPTEIQRVLMTIKSKTGNVQVDKFTNSLIITDTPEKIKEMEGIIAQVDYETTTHMYTLKHTNADRLIPLLQGMLSEGGGKVFADKRTNTLVITDTPAVIAKVSGMIKSWDEETVTKTFVLNYANPVDVQTKIAGLITPEAGSIYVDERTNSITLMSVPSLLEKAEKIILASDLITPQVLIEAKIFDITLNDSNKMGIDWEAVAKNANAKGVFSVLPTEMTAGSRATTTGTFNNINYEALLEALKSTSDVNLLASPRIAVVNNTEAKILVGSSEPYTVVTTTDIGNTNTRLEDTKFIEVGTKLLITPQINEDNYITIKVHTEKSFASEHAAGVAPTVTTSEADTKVIVKDGQTAIIAGLVKDEKTYKTSKIPILGSIPVAGLAFRSREKAATKTELAIFITPTIITGKAVGAQELERYTKEHEKASGK